MPNTLILKKRGQRFRFEMRPQTTGNFHPSNCNMEVNAHNYKDFALFLSDLKAMWSVPVDKAIEEYIKKKGKIDDNPFW